MNAGLSKNSLSVSDIDQIGCLLHYPSGELSLSFVESEEADVWRVGSRSDQRLTFAWLKRHIHAGKADQEERAILDWGERVGAPTVITRLDPRSLLLTHCTGDPISVWETESASAVGERVALLHEQPYQDRDSLPLAQAIMLRAQKSISGIPTVIEKLYEEDEALGVIAQAHFPKIKDRIDRKQQWILESERRVPCHRDLRPDHILFSEDQEPLSAPSRSRTLSLIDWGQSRGDHWSSDWIKLWLDPEMGDHFSDAWRSYWANRSQPVAARYDSLQMQAVVYVLNTLIWSIRSIRRADQDLVQARATWLRGIDELRVLNKRLSNL